MNITIESPKGIGPGTKIYDEKGNSIPGIRSLSLDISLKEANRAFVELVAVSVKNLKADAEFLICHPDTNTLEPVSTVIFKDGTVWSAA